MVVPDSSLVVPPGSPPWVVPLPPGGVLASVLALPGSRLFPEMLPVVPVIITALVVPLSPTEVVASVLELPGATVVPGMTLVVPVTLSVAWPSGPAVVPA